MDIKMIAAVAHEVNRAYCVSLGDDSQPAWKEAPKWQRKSIISGVRFICDNPDATPQQSHENWLAEKKAGGWVYGPEKNPETKEHPCCVPYDDLPQEQRSKDYIFRGTVQILLTLFGNASGPVLMSPENPDGWKLEDLLGQLLAELDVKCGKIVGDDRLQARVVLQNNRRIMTALQLAQDAQRFSYQVLDEMAPNQGPLGKPRIGVGS